MTANKIMRCAVETQSPLDAIKQEGQRRRRGKIAAELKPGRTLPDHAEGALQRNARLS